MVYNPKETCEAGAKSHSQIRAGAYGKLALALYIDTVSPDVMIIIALTSTVQFFINMVKKMR